ncbi:hypothetical protein YPPY76_0115, partial [Yersinia pestis PY-76]
MAAGPTTSFSIYIS